MQSTYQSVPFEFLPGSKWKRFLSVQNILYCNSRAVHFKFRQTLTINLRKNRQFTAGGNLRLKKELSLAPQSISTPRSYWE
jgi:hypothetical protein